MIWVLWIVGVILVGALGFVLAIRSSSPPPDPRDTRGSDELDEAWRKLSPRARAWIINERKRERSEKE